MSLAVSSNRKDITSSGLAAPGCSSKEAKDDKSRRLSVAAEIARKPTAAMKVSTCSLLMSSRCK